MVMEMCDTCDDSRFELIKKYKQKLLDATNIGDSPEEMAVIDNILFRFWQIGWLNLATDTISRQDAITLLEEAESAWLRGDILLFYPVMLNGLKKLPSAQPVAKDINVPVKDCISREVAIETVRKAKSIGQAHRMLAQLPSAQPDIVVCGDCIHWICHDRRCGYWNHGVKPLDWCCHAERRTDGRPDKQTGGDKRH